MILESVQNGFGSILRSLVITARHLGGQEELLGLRTKDQLALSRGIAQPQLRRELPP